MVIKSVSRPPPPLLVNVGSENMQAPRVDFHANGEVPTLTIRGGGGLLLFKKSTKMTVFAVKTAKRGQKGQILTSKNAFL